MAETPERVIVPTPEQAEVIEQPLQRSVLVLAGAGSGKTETMANRVVWLVANGMVRPSQILGLTFTRKAAGELAERVVDRLQRFAARLEAAAQRSLLTADELRCATKMRALMSEGIELPEMSTYNAFAAAIVQEFGAFAGVAAGGTVIDEATAWGIARAIVCESEDEALIAGNESIATIVKHTMQLNHAVADNLSDLDRVLQLVQETERIAELPYNEKKREGRYAKITEVLEQLRATRVAVRLAHRYAETKRQRGMLEFSDQLALAVTTLRSAPAAVRSIRQRTPVVLLDEVQDTSVGQTTLLSLLFRGMSVMAVGDPHQSIYGFRGASASNLQSFHHDFRAAPVPTEQRKSGDGNAWRGVTLHLSTSWRNPSSVLRAANTVSAALAMKLEAGGAGSLTVKPLTSRAQYEQAGAADAEVQRVREAESAHQVTVRFEETIEQEFAALAEWLQQAREQHTAETGNIATAAVLFRNRRHMPAVSAALSARGIPNRIVGIGGLLGTPEVTDVVSTLHGVWHADASSELVRILAGPRFRLGVADLHGLAQAAAWFSRRDRTHSRDHELTESAATKLSDDEEKITLLDALDEIAGLPQLDHPALHAITPTGRDRLREAGQMFRMLRRENAGNIPSLLRQIVQHLRLDIELDTAEHTGYNGAAAARANLDAFFELVNEFLAHDEQATLASLLAWIERAKEADEAAEHAPEPQPGTVQLMTVHGAKGLEWHLVVVPRMVTGEFPATPREGMGWLRAGQLPDRLRGDAAARPVLHLDHVHTQKEATEAIAAYQEALRQRHADEERRLAYVAITRAAARLLLTGSFWGGQRTPRAPAIFLQELADARIIGSLPQASAYVSEPEERAARTIEWPLDPLGRRAQPVLAAAERLRAALQTGEQPAPLHPVARLLLAERAAAQATPDSSRTVTDATDSATTRPITASAFHEHIEDPVAAERRRLRPMPVRPYRGTRVGNLFHEWVQRRASTARGTALTLPTLEHEHRLASDRADERDTDPSLQQLIAQFERSRWAQLQPCAVELEISLPFAGRTLVCKLDAIYRYGEDSDHGGSQAAGGRARYEIVDWKTGDPPRDEQQRASRFLQLELYRHAYARWAQIDPNRIDVTLFYVAAGIELRGGKQKSYEELEALWRDAAASLPSSVNVASANRRSSSSDSSSAVSDRAS